ncbi:MAG: LysE family transporter [Promethearchaeota archaeon]
MFQYFLLTVVLVTMSGALSPGPLLVTNLSNAPRWGWKGGFWLSVGHTFVELPLILLVAIGLNFVINNYLLKMIVAAVGGIVLLIFAGLQIREVLRSRAETEPIKAKPATTRHPLLAGLIFTGLNPYFLVWWLTAGANLVLEALLLAAIAGVFIMFAAHIWMDYAWLTGTAWLANKGTNLVGSKGYTVLMLVFAAFLIYFGLSFCWDAFLLSLLV